MLKAVAGLAGMAVDTGKVLGEEPARDKPLGPSVDDKGGTHLSETLEPRLRVASCEDLSGLVFPNGDCAQYSAGDRLVTHEIQTVKIGLAICYALCWLQSYIAYRKMEVSVMLHSFHNARMEARNCLETLIVRQAPTHCAENRMWAVCNNSSRRHSEWGSFVARPDATIAKRLSVNRPGLLLHDFPDGLSQGDWLHNYRPMDIRDSKVMQSGTVSSHPRRLNGQAEF